MKKSEESMKKMIAKGMKKVCVEAIDISMKTTCGIFLAQPKKPEKIDIKSL